MEKQEHNSFEVAVHPDHKSRGDELLEQFRREAVFTDQFRMGTVFFLMTVAALVAVLPRFFGAKPISFFVATGIVASALGPLTTLVANGFFPVFSQRLRVYLSAGLLLLLAIGWFALLAYSEGSRNDFALAFCGLTGLWMVQGIAIWLLWRSLFRRRHKESLRAVADQFGQPNNSTCASSISIFSSDSDADASRQDGISVTIGETRSS